MLLKVAFLLLVVWVLGTLEARDGAAKRESNS